MKRPQAVIAIVTFALSASASLFLLSCKPQPTTPSQTTTAPLRVGISAYQDLAMLTVHDSLKLDDKYGTHIELVDMPWEKILTTLASAGPTVDIGFASLIEFLTKYNNINPDDKDPLVYVFPAYVFKGGGFISFNPKVPDLNLEQNLSSEASKAFLAFRIGSAKNTMFDMMIFSLARRAGVPRKQLQLTDTSMADGLLAAQAGSLDVAAAGLTQRNEALEHNGRVVLTMEKLGFADLTGFVCKKSVLTARRKDIENLIRIWFDSVNYVYADLDNNSKIPLEWLAKKASTQYTAASYKRALEAEYLPRSLEEAQKELVSDSGKFSIGRISSDVKAYLAELSPASGTPPPQPTPIDIHP